MPANQPAELAALAAENLKCAAVPYMPRRKIVPAESESQIYEGEAWPVYSLSEELGTETELMEDELHFVHKALSDFDKAQLILETAYKRAIQSINR